MTGAPVEGASGMTDPLLGTKGAMPTDALAAPSSEAHDENPVILVVDDDPLLGQVVAACLNFEGAEVRSAHTVADARAELHPGLAHVVLDRRLPDGDGLDLLDDLAARCPDVPVVVFTAYDDDHDHPEVRRIDKADVALLVDVLGLEEEHVPPTTPPALPDLPPL